MKLLGTEYLTCKYFMGCAVKWRRMKLVQKRTKEPEYRLPADSFWSTEDLTMELSKDGPAFPLEADSSLLSWRVPR